VKFFLAFLITFLLIFTLWPSDSYYHPCNQNNILAGQCAPKLKKNEYGGGTKFVYALIHPDYRIEESIPKGAYEVYRNVGGGSTYKKQFIFAPIKALIFAILAGINATVLTFLITKFSRKTKQGSKT
jgi:hypothetical protein